MNFVQQKQLLIWNRQFMKVLKSWNGFPFPKSCFLAVHEELAQRDGGGLLGEVSGRTGGLPRSESAGATDWMAGCSPLFP